MSKELEALKELKESIITLVQDYGTYGSNREEIYNSQVLKEERKSINILETAIEALEIIEERLNFNFDDETKSISITRNNGFMHITLFFDKQEEFDLLKEVLL